MHFTVDISGNALGGIVAGAVTAAIVIAIFSAIGAFFESMMSLGGSGGFGEKLWSGCRIYVPVGAAIGGGVAATGLPWWTAIFALIVVFFLLGLIMKVREGVRRRARGY